MNAEQIKDDIRKLSRIDKIEIYRWIDEKQRLISFQDRISPSIWPFADEIGHDFVADTKSGFQARQITGQMVRTILCR